MPFLKDWTSEAGLGEIYSADPHIYHHLPAMTEALMRGRSTLSIPLREFIAAYVSALNRCEFCVSGHTAMLSTKGNRRELLQRAIDHPDTFPRNSKVRVLLQFARKLTLEPARISQQDVDAIFSAGWDEKAFRDTVAITARMNLANRLVSGFGLSANSANGPYDGQSGKRLTAFRERMRRKHREPR